jgi:tetratricopeptide (TPR) repeat protein
MEDMGMGLLNKLFDAAKNPKEDRSDYGSLFIPPSAEAGALQAALTEEEKANFIDLLRHLQEWYDSGSEEGPVSFHPEARAVLWGTALAKIADHYRSIGRNDKALFFLSNAYNLSQHPFFAYNVAMLSAEAGDLKRAQTLLEIFLAHHQNMLTSPLLKLANPDITTGELEDMVKSARATLASIKSRLA